MQHLQVEPVVVRNKQNVRPEEIEKLMERICRLDAMFIEIIHTPGDDRRDRPLQPFSIGTLEAAKAAAFELGVSRGIDPFMTLSFMALPVIPKLRITTRGVIDVETQQYV